MGLLIKCFYATSQILKGLEASAVAYNQQEKANSAEDLVRQEDLEAESAGSFE